MHFRIIISIYMAAILLCPKNASALNPSYELEPNDSTGIASVIALGAGDITGDLSSLTDMDYYSFTSTGGVVQFTIKPTTGSSGSLKVIILDASNNVLTSDTRSYSSSTPTHLQEPTTCVSKHMMHLMQTMTTPGIMW